MSDQESMWALARKGMVLRTSLTSPFGRKVRMAGKILGLEELLTIEHADTLDENDTLRQQNPLGKLPTIILADGRIIYDSDVIVEFLDNLGGKPRLAPASGIDRYVSLTHAKLANGITDAALLMVYESRFRSDEPVSQRWLAHQRGKLERTLEAIHGILPDPAETNIVSISLACALGYLDWRKPIVWRERYPELVDWLARFAELEPSYNATTRPEGT